MKCLITGCNGFIGSHLAEYLLAQEMAAYGTFHSTPTNLGHLRDRLTLLQCDVSDRERVREIFAEVQPERIFHLAAQSLPVRSWEDPEKTFQVNLLGTLHVLEATRQHAPGSTLVVLGSSAEYARAQDPTAGLSEQAALQPDSPYGISKLSADLLSAVYVRAYKMRIVRVRPFFVVGPGRASNACTDFARRIAEIEFGLADGLSVGNLEAVRDVVDVRDAVKALWLLNEKGTPGQVYNLCSGRGWKMREILDQLLVLSRSHISVRVDPNRFRPLDTPVLVGDNTALRELGWQPEIPLQKTLSDILDFWRMEVQRSMQPSR